MIPRYSRPEMVAIWDPQTRFRIWFEIEAHATDALAELGVVPKDATGGCPNIVDFAGGATGYLAKVDFVNTVACRVRIFDLLWKGGAYAFNASTSGNTPTTSPAMVTAPA